MRAILFVFVSCVTYTVMGRTVTLGHVFGWTVGYWICRVCGYFFERRFGTSEELAHRLAQRLY